MLFLSVTSSELIQNIQNKSFALELRLDLFPRRDMEYIKHFLQTSACPVMLTLRKASEGGKFQGTESQREILIEQLLSFRPSYFDLEYDMRPQFLHETIKRHPQTQFILSYHHFAKTPINLDEIYRSMEKYEVFSYKIAVIMSSINDALKMLLFVKTHPKVSAICMGEQGKFARVLGPIVGNRVDYASIDAKEQTEPGQLSVSELVDVYHYPSLNEKTCIYGLIGDPVEKSQGHLYHNAVFSKRHLNAVYVKMCVKPEELSVFIPLAKAIGIRGLSVTTPLKEKILPFVDEIEPSAQQIGAVNTLLFQNGQIIGTNTDGLGALDAIEKKISVSGKKIVLLGAGGAARAIAYEAKRRGVDVLILNRTMQRAKELAEQMQCEAGGLDEVPERYDILVNCSPDSMPIDPKKIRPQTVVMDIVYFPHKTAFLKEASLKKCHIIYGVEMFINQAAHQSSFWMDA